MKRRNQNPSIRQIAAELEVSKSTVALALNTLEEDCPLASATRTKIREAAHKMGYRTNAIARTMRTGKFNAASLLVGNTHPFFLPAEMVNGMEEVLEQKKYRMQISWLNEDKLSRPNYIPDVLKERSSDGLLIHYPGDIPENIQQSIRRHQIPCVVANNKLESDCVYPDDYGAAFQATQTLLELGHRDIGYLHYYNNSHHYSERDRLKGYTDAMRQAGLKARDLFPEKTIPPLSSIHTRDQRFEMSTTLLQSQDRPTAILCYEIAEAAPLLAAALPLKVSIPGDLSLIAFGRINRNDTGRPLSTVRLRLQEVGQRAAAMLLRKIDAPDIPQKPEIVPLKLESPITVSPPL